MKFLAYKNKIFLSVILIILGLITRFAFFGHPKEVVFDEVFFGSQASFYFSGQKYFDVHPPLGKMIIALGAKLFNYSEYVQENGIFIFEKIGTPFIDQLPYLGFRFFPTLFGAFIPFLVFYLLLKIKLRTLYAFSAGLSLVFSNFLITHLRFALIDSFLIFFGLLSLIFFIRFQKSNFKNFFYLILSSIFIGLTISIKWTGLSFIAIIFFYLTYKLIKKNLVLKKIINFSLIYLLISLILYLLFYFIHFSILKNESTNRFNSGINLEQMNQMHYWKKLFFTHKKALELHSSLKEASHSFSSKPIEWLNMQKPILYWSKENNNQEQSKIILLGNPVLWWLSLIGIISFLIFYKKINFKKDYKFIILIAFLTNYLPYFFIKRKLFLYSFSLAFIFSIIIFFIVFENFNKNFNKNKKIEKIGLSILFALIIFFYFYIADFSYGLPQNEETIKKKTEFILNF
jgi:dolichyl-phosphate-mannose-protein mannosyltransferase